MNKYIVSFNNKDLKHSCPLSTVNHFIIKFVEEKGEAIVQINSNIMYAKYELNENKMELYVMWQDKICHHTIKNYMIFAIANM